MKNESFDIANMPKYGYINRALSKISKLALVGYEYSAHTVRLKGFFVCVISLCVRMLWRSWRGSVRACQSPELLVDQPLSALPPKLFGRNWQSSYKLRSALSCLIKSILKIHLKLMMLVTCTT